MFAFLRLAHRFARKNETTVREVRNFGNGFPEDNFELESFKKKTVDQKREKFWKLNSGRFTVISTIAMIGMFVIAYFVYIGIADFITNFNIMR